MKSVMVFGWSGVILFLSFVLSFSFVWEDIYQTAKTVLDHVSKHFEAFQNSVLRYASYFQLSLRVWNFVQSRSFVFDHVVNLFPSLFLGTPPRMVPYTGHYPAVAVHWCIHSRSPHLHWKHSGYHVRLWRKICLEASDRQRRPNSNSSLHSYKQTEVQMGLGF